MMSITVHIGVIGSGKDYRSGRLEESGYGRADFKDALLDMVSDIAGYDVRADYEWFKDHPVGVMRPANPLAEAFLRSEWKDILQKHPEIITGRRLLQRVGTEAIRKRHPNYWVDQFVAKAEKTLSEGRGVANSDCRFFNEIESIKNFPRGVLGGRVSSTFIFCDFRSARYNPKFDHASERLAQTFLGMGLRDGEIITDYQFSRAAEIMGETFKS